MHLTYLLLSRREEQGKGELFCYCFAFWQSLVLLKVSFLSLLSDRPRRCCSNNDS